MFCRLLAALAISAAFSAAQTVCAPIPQFTPCDLVFELPEAAGNVDIRAEFRSPRAQTALVHAFEDGPRRWIVRFTPIEIGTYAWRVTSRVAQFNGKQGELTVTPAAAKKTGWLRAANLHHFADVEGNAISPHLWMGALVPGFAAMDAGQWQQLVATRARQHFNHLGVTLVDESAGGESSAARFQAPEFFRAAEEKIRAANAAGIVVDIAFFSGNQLMRRLLPARADREKWLLLAVSRLAAFDVTWQGVERWESGDDGRQLMKEIGELVTSLDPYKHPRSTRTALTTGPLADDGWLRYRSYETGDDAVTAIEQQVFQYPSVNNFATATMDADSFRHRLWNATVNGNYPAPVIPNEQAAAAMKLWYEFMQSTRHWELEPFFDTSVGRGLALEGIEYIIYLDKPGPVTVNYEKHSYDGEWWNPATGQTVKIKDVKGESFTGTPPDLTHDWVLHISREGAKAGMLKSVKFDSREQPAELQQIESDPAKVPFDVVEPSAAELSLSRPARFEVKLKRQSKALERMLYEWTAEVTADGRSYRVAGTGASGTLNIPADITGTYPAALHLRVFGMNALGKVYSVDRNYTITK